MTDTTSPRSDSLESGFDSLFGVTFQQFLTTTWPDKFLKHDGDVSRLTAISDLPELKGMPSLFDAYRRGDATQQDVTLVDFDGEGRKRSRICDAQTAFKAYESASESRSVLFSRLERYVPGVERCKRYFEGRIGVQKEDCTAYAVLSRPGKGFALHFDNQSVINIQLRGSKRWRVGKTPAVPNPLATHSVGVPLNALQRLYWPAGEPNNVDYDPPDAHEFVMTPGTVSFVPRGHWHRTVALEESLSLVLTYAGVPCVDLLLERLRGELIRHEAWRAPLLGGYIGKPNEMTDRMKAQARNVIARWARDIEGVVTEDGLIPKSSGELRGLDDVMRRMGETFDAKHSAGLTVSFQFCAQGNRVGDFHAVVRDGTVQLAKGQVARPDLTITASTDDLVTLAGDIGRGLQLYSAGRLSMEPMNLELASQLPKIFHVFEGA